MERIKPSCPLEEVRRLIDDGKVRETAMALRCAADLGLSRADIRRIVRSLKPADFYKSMTAYHDSRIWHDVYRPRTLNG